MDENLPPNCEKNGYREGPRRLEGGAVVDVVARLVDDRRAGWAWRRKWPQQHSADVPGDTSVEAL